MTFRPLALMLMAPLATATLGAGGALAAPTVCGTVPGNLVANCSFEDLTSWSPAVIQYQGLQNSGQYAEFLGVVGDNQPFVEQTITTTAGATYDLSFFARAFSGLSMLAKFDGQTVVTTGSLSTSYQEFTASVTATSTSSVLRFEYVSGYGGLDDVSLVLTSQPPSTPAPEPASLAVLGTGLAALTGLRRRRDTGKVDSTT